MMAAKKKEEMDATTENETLGANQEEIEKAEAAQPQTVTLTMDELKKLIAEEISKAQPEGQESNGVIESDQERKAREHYEELVEVELFFDGDKYKDDVIVNVNGKAWQIQRGVPVKVPRFVKAVLDSSAKQDAATNRMVRELSEKFEEKTRLYS